MAANQQNKNDAFFQLLADDKPARSTIAENPFAEDEIVFKDEAGAIKVLKGTRVTTLPNAASAGTVAAVATTVPQPSPAAPVPGDAIAEAVAKRRAELERVVESIVNHHRLKKTFTEQALEHRFQKIISSRLRGIRSQIETREILTQPLSDGGMGFSLAEAEAVLMLVSQEYQRLADSDQAGANLPSASLSAEGRKLLEAPSVPIPPKLTFTDPIVRSLAVAPPPVVSLPAAIAPRPAPPDKPMAPAPKPLTPSPMSADATPMSRQAVSESPMKPRIEDVRFKPKSMGPLDEIQALTLIDLRRLASDPRTAAGEIMEKVGRLEQESFSQRIAAIRAWQQSPVYRLYLELGGQSMEKTQPIASVIGQRQAAGEPTLTEAEFEAISDLNQKLRY